MTLKLQWHGQEEFASQPLRGWNVTSDSGDGKTYEAGLTRNVGSLTYATVHGGGHMVCFQSLGWRARTLNLFDNSLDTV